MHFGEAIWSDSRETGGEFTMSVVYIVHMVDRLGQEEQENGSGLCIKVVIVI